MPGLVPGIILEGAKKDVRDEPGHDEFDGVMPAEIDIG